MLVGLEAKLFSDYKNGQLQLVQVPASRGSDSRFGIVLNYANFDATYLSLTYAALVASIAVMYTRAARTTPHKSGDAQRRARLAWAGTGLFLVAAALPWPVSSALWVVGLAALIVSTLAGTLAEGDAGLDEHHLVERMGAFTIIVCGEAFVKVAIAVSGSSVLEVDVIALFFEFVLTFAIWTSYFEDVPQAGIRADRLHAWFMSHLLLQLAIAGASVLIGAGDIAGCTTGGDALTAVGPAFGLKPTGLLALDVARIEAGLLLTDVDFFSARKASSASLISSAENEPLSAASGGT
jgi:hypothetical protein